MTAPIRETIARAITEDAWGATYEMGRTSLPITGGAAHIPEAEAKRIAEEQAAQQQADYEAMSEKQLARELKRLEKEMLEYARNLEFEKAAAARDELFRIRQQVFGISGEQANIDAS